VLLSRTRVSPFCERDGDRHDDFGRRDRVGVVVVDRPILFRARESEKLVRTSDNAARTCVFNAVSFYRVFVASSQPTTPCTVDAVEERLTGPLPPLLSGEFVCAFRYLKNLRANCLNRV